uniref:uncharacterized protein LOC122579204 n=1 Tax=Erigeron canadensis TaxID=72917 RepID=UPI001CB8DFA9|nr:uncharacterized protein LOC122579204 [Erigeron canadensis]
MQMSSISPSFTSHSSNNLADIAARVVEEFRIENGHDDQLDDIFSNDFYDDISLITEKQTQHENEHKKDQEEEEKEFEFAVICNNSSSLSPLSPISADEIFFNGEIVPRYPLFDQSLLLDSKNDIIASNNETKLVGLKHSPKDVRRQPLSMFFNEDRDCNNSTVSCSSSESDDLDGAAPGTYCIWKPKEELLLEEEKCKKSNSTGNSSKRWKLRNLLSRSHSDRNFSKDDAASIVVFSPKKGGEKMKFEKSAKVAGAEDDDDEIELPAKTVVDEKIKSKKEGNRIRSFVSFKEMRF